MPYPDNPPEAPPSPARCPGCNTPLIADLPACLDCAVCAVCGEHEPRRLLTETVRGSLICGDCLRDYYWRCPHCEGWNRDGDSCPSDHDFCECEDCNDGDEQSDAIWHYEYKPTPVFHGAGPLFLGPEIELETPYGRRADCAEFAVDQLGDLGYLKEDGSLSNGFEIVTHPMSYPWAIAHFPWPLLEGLDRRGCATPSNTGMHVHLSRDGFSSPCHVYRWMKFVFRNQPQVTTLARRASSSYAAFNTADRYAVKYFAKGGRGDRYTAINTRNLDTFELRIFASSLRPAVVQAALAFADASVAYTRGLDATAVLHRAGWAWPAFVAWLDERDEYAPLTNQLRELDCRR